MKNNSCRFGTLSVLIDTYNNKCLVMLHRENWCPTIGPRSYKWLPYFKMSKKK